MKLLDLIKATKPNFVISKPIKKICKKLDDFVSGKIKNLIIAIPPRTCKTELGVRSFIPLLLAAKNNGNIAIAAQTTYRAEQLALDVRRIINSSEYESFLQQHGYNNSHLSHIKDSY